MTSEHLREMMGTCDAEPADLSPEAAQTGYGLVTVIEGNDDPRRTKKRSRELRKLVNLVGYFDDSEWDPFTPAHELQCNRECKKIDEEVEDTLEAIYARHGESCAIVYFGDMTDPETQIERIPFRLLRAATPAECLAYMTYVVGKSVQRRGRE
jgi:hypothetical protein